MKTNIKRTLSVAIILFILLQIVMPLTVKAETNYPSLAEAKKLLAKIPDEITLNIKESEFYEKADLLAREKILKILGIPDDGEHDFLYCSIVEASENGYIERDNTDIHKTRVTILNSGKENISKVIKLNYSNTKNWNQKDYEYVKQLADNTNFHRRWDFEINPDGTQEEWQDKSDFDWKKVMENANDKKINDVTVIPVGFNGGGSDFNGGTWYNIYLVKNDIVYYVKMGSKQDTARITIPDNIKETDEAYINYAKPIIEKYLYEEYYDDYNKEKRIYKSTVIEMKREREDFISFDLKIKAQRYINGVLDKNYGSEPYEDSIIIAKENEYRGTTNANLTDISIQKSGKENYITGTLKVTEIDIGYEYSLGTKIPVVKIIDSTGKETKIEVKQKDFSIYEFEIPTSAMKNSQAYKIYVESPFENNKSPLKNTYVSKNETGKTQIKSDNLTLNIENKSNVVTLTLNQTKFKLGDVNGDNQINTLDAVMILQSVAKKITLNADQKTAADVNNDKKVDTLDAVKILQFVAKKIPTL